MTKIKTSAVILTMAVLLFAGCSDSRTISLAEGLMKVKEGKYSLVAVADGFISFQVDGFHKYQYYGDRKAISDALPELTQALSIASNSGFSVTFMDARNQKPNQGKESIR